MTARAGIIMGLAAVMALSAVPWAAAETVSFTADGQRYSVEYTGPEITRATVDLEFGSLILETSVQEASTLEITFPRSVFDSKLGDEDAEFIVLADGDEGRSTESSTADSRTLTISLDAGTTEVEIIGSQFGAAEAEDPEPPRPGPEPESPEQPAAPAPAAPSGCGEGLILRDGVCQLACGQGLVLEDGVCVIDSSMIPTQPPQASPAAPQAQPAPVGSNRELVVGVAAAFVIAFFVMIILWAISRASRKPDAAAGLPGA